MAPVNVISVAVVASDPLTRDGALARLSSHRELDVRAWQAGCETSVLLVLATTITAPLLCQIEDVQKDGPSHAPKLVVVADEFSAEQVFRMIKLGLTGLLYRSQSTFDCIVETSGCPPKAACDSPNVSSVTWSAASSPPRPPNLTHRAPPLLPSVRWRCCVC
ncbi:two component system transcriptional regulator, luxR-family [Mycobacterium tuberculosis T46]|nr:two component system transcriptional regulator, luxR-family [Mycobacterium tuberculosis T46]